MSPKSKINNRKERKDFSQRTQRIKNDKFILCALCVSFAPLRLKIPKPETIMYNFHSHTNFCDGAAPPEDYIVEAIKQGFKSYGFSAAPEKP